MKLSQWAKEQGITYATAWNWFKKGTLPVRAEQMKTGTILVYPDQPISPAHKEVTIYVRAEKDDLIPQLERCRNFCLSNDYLVKNEIIDTQASGVRKRLNALLEDNTVTTIVVERQNTVSEFDFDRIQSALMAQNREIVVINV